MSWEHTGLDAPERSARGEGLPPTALPLGGRPVASAHAPTRASDAGRFKRIVFFLVDGARPDVLEELRAAGDLPNLSRHLLEPSGERSVRTATTVFPSTTGAAYIPFLTGCYPGTVDVPGIRWFDRTAYASGWRGALRRDRFRSYVGPAMARLGRDTNLAGETLFETFPNHANIFGCFTRGVRPGREFRTPGRDLRLVAARLTKNWQPVDDYSARQLERALEIRPDFTFSVFLAVDENSHHDSPRGPSVLAAYRAFDRTVGRVVEQLRRLGTLEDTVFVVTSDHGLSETPRHFDLDRFIEQRNPGALYYPTIWRGFFGGAPAATMVSGNAMAHVYLRAPEGDWARPVRFEELSGNHVRWRNGDLVDALIADDRVDVVAGRGAAPGTVVARTRRGTAEISERDGGARIGYRILDGADPFGFGPMPAELSADDTLLQTNNTEFPDALVQLAQLFRSRRTGDLVVSASPGCDLRERFEFPEHLSGHGSLRRAHMHVPFITNARVPAGPVRSADFHPTLLRLVGHPARPLQSGSPMADGRARV